MTAGARNLADRLGLRPLRWWERAWMRLTRRRQPHHYVTNMHCRYKIKRHRDGRWTGKLIQCKPTGPDWPVYEMKRVKQPWWATDKPSRRK